MSEFAGSKHQVPTFYIPSNHRRNAYKWCAVIRFFTDSRPFFFFGLGIHKLACWVQSKRAQVETQYWRNPEVARLEGNPTIHVTSLYISWYVRVVDTHSILEYHCLDLSFHERDTAWLFHVGASQYYCVSHLSSRRSNCGLTMQGSCLKDRRNLRTVAKGRDTPKLLVDAPWLYVFIKNKCGVHAVMYST